MQKIRTNKGYLFKIWNTTVSKINNEYTIQSKLPFVGLINHYKSNIKPKYTNLYWYSILSYIKLPKIMLIILLLSCSYFIGRGLYIISKLFLMISYLMMLMPNSAKHELKELFEVWGKDI